MEFFLGIIVGFVVGLIVAILIVAVLTYFKKSIEHKTTVLERLVESKGPKPKGFISVPLDEATEAREDIIARNRALGKDTPLSDLI
jgi:hypothetical protein